MSYSKQKSRIKKIHNYRIIDEIFNEIFKDLQEAIQTAEGAADIEVEEWHDHLKDLNKIEISHAQKRR